MYSKGIWICDRRIWDNIGHMGDFATLTHLVKIDLSKNVLTELPSNFGNLFNLQTLDLYENQLRTLPVSFCRLKNLRWLDLKNNPLDTRLKAVAGDCIDDKQCQKCAKQVVSFMQSIDSDLEREKQKKLKERRAKEAVQKEIMEKELEEQRRLKKLEKEKRKAESKAKRNEKRDKRHMEDNEEEFNGDDVAENVETAPVITFRGFFSSFFLFFLLGSATVFLYHMYQDEHFQRKTLPKLQALASEYATKFQHYVSRFLSALIPIFKDLKSDFLQVAHHAMILVTNFFRQLEHGVKLLMSFYYS
ncbi:leucine-rich repeat-containing protein 59-like isoform X2 [Uloborus diversus]|uniref:leucine-rich repeat-containing protein 59-like isoform X2 n=1 Tax=Uloborus diversus TaxID=327109 RepID=UPI00240A4BA1|nr:leucine-rich repeat-containing protein 59-like isoform X2 [Uloborus diversus]